MTLMTNSNPTVSTIVHSCLLDSLPCMSFVHNSLTSYYGTWLAVDDGSCRGPNVHHSFQQSPHPRSKILPLAFESGRIVRFQ